MYNLLTISNKNEWRSEFGIVPIFSEVAKKYPNVVAVRSARTEFTYFRLDKFSTTLAKNLLNHFGTKPIPVAILLDNEAQLIACLLGVIKAGFYYCALAKHDPAAQLKSVLRDLNSPVLITDEKLYSLACQVSPPGCKVVIATDIRGLEEMTLPSTYTPDTFLGIFYTSGSSGEPKGVIRTHAFVLHRLVVDTWDYSIGVGDKLLYMKQFNVSSSLSSIFDTLLTGATLDLYDANSYGITSLLEFLKSKEITIFVPPIELLRLFLDSLEEYECIPSVRVVILGGDVLFRRDVQRLRLHLSESSVIVHHLSSSESGLLARTILHYDSPITSDIVPVGFPVAGKEILILDDQGKPLPDGVAGEITVRSDVLFPGYLNLPNQSNTKFRIDPQNPARKVFCTGDLGYFLPDRKLMFLGRNDLRVKIRGFSVDCASVESALMAEPGINRAVVVPRIDPSGHKRLVGYILPSPNSNISSSSLRNFLRERIPPYMVPTNFVFVNELPLNSSMKVDRKGLPDPDWSQIPTYGRFTPPGDEVEQKLVNIWQHVLSLERVGIDDDFFDIGGDSLSAMVLLSEVENLFKKTLPLRSLVEDGTIRHLAQWIRNPQSDEMKMLVTFSQVGEGLPVYLIPTGTGDAMGMLAIARLLEGPQPVYGLQASGLGTENLYRWSTEEIAARFIQVLRQVQPHGPYRIIGGSFGGLVAFEMSRILQEAGEVVDVLGLIDTQPPGPRRGPQMRDRLKVYWQNLRKLSTLPLKRYPGLFTRWWRGHVDDLARRQLLPKEITAKALNKAFKGYDDPKHPGHVAHILYFPRVYAGDVVIFRAKDKPWFTPKNEMAGWGKYVKGEITIVDVEGNHGQVYSEPYAAGLVQAIRTFLV